MSADQQSLYYRTARGEQEQGPIGLDELEELVKQALLTRYTEVRREGTSVWIRLGRFLNLPDSKLPEEKRSSVPELASLIDTIVIDSSDTVTKKSVPKAERWYCRVYGKELGPVEVPLLRQMAEQRQLYQTDRVRREGEKSWLLADAIPGLFEGIGTQPPTDLPLTGSMSVAPQRLSNRPRKKAAEVPAPRPEETKPAATKPDVVPAAAAPPDVGSPKPSAPPSPPARTNPAASLHANPAMAPVRPAAPASPFASAAPPSFQHRSFSPPPKRSRSRDWSFSLPDFGNIFGSIDPKNFVIGLVALAAVCVLAFQLGLFSAGYKLVKNTVGGKPAPNPNSWRTNWDGPE